MARVERVPTARQIEALELVAGSGRRGWGVREASRSLRQYIRQQAPWRASLWWTLHDDEPVAAGLLLRSPGRTGLLLHSTTDFGLVPPAALTALLQGMAKELVGPEMVLLQALLLPESHDDIRAFERAGYERLAELIFLRLHLQGRAGEPEPPGIEWLTYSPLTHEDFAAAIEATYEQSLDCPALEGLRSMEDVIEGHKASGSFDPDLWTLARIEGRPAGVILLSDNPSQNSLEVVYMGVGAPYRGRRLGRALLERAAGLAARIGRADLTLAVDAKNRHARQLYEGMGFVSTTRRLAYARVWRCSQVPGCG